MRNTPGNTKKVNKGREKKEERKSGRDGRRESSVFPLRYLGLYFNPQNLYNNKSSNEFNPQGFTLNINT